MNPTKTIVDQAEAALRLFFAESREDASRLLEMYGPLVRMFEQDLDAAVEVRHLVLDRFRPAEPPAVPGLDFLPVTQADADVLVAEAVAVLDEPTFCANVYVGSEGEFKCDRFAGHGDHHWNLLAEFGWPVVESLDAPAPEKVLTGEVTSPYGPCSGLAADKRDNTCTNFAAEYVSYHSEFWSGLTCRRLCTSCAAAAPNVLSRSPLTTAPGGYPVERAS